MNEHLEHRNTTQVDIFDLLWSDVLPLSQLEDVLLPVNDAQRAILTKRCSLELLHTLEETWCVVNKWSLLFGLT